MTKLTIEAPADRAELSSPLAILRLRYEGAKERTATIHVGEVVHVVELEGESGVLHENITLLEGKSRIRAEAGGAHAEISVELKRSKDITFTAPQHNQSIAERATGVTGSYQRVSCPAGVIAVNGFMQQFSVRGNEGTFDEKIVLRPGANHVAVQIGELYATRLVTGSFPAAKLLVTLVWDTPSTDVDLYVYEPSGLAVFFSNKQQLGTLDVDRQQGFGPENYSIVKAPAGDYHVRVHYYADRGLGRTEWTVRVISDESTPRQRRANFYGILDYSRPDGDPNGEGRDWNQVCRVDIDTHGNVTIREA